MAFTHRVLRVHGGRLVNVEPRRELEAGLDAASAEGYEMADTFAIDDNVYIVLRRPAGAGVSVLDPPPPA